MEKRSYYLKSTPFEKIYQPKNSGSTSRFSGNFRLPAEFNANTYYSAPKGCFIDCSLRVEKLHPDSIDDLYIKTFPMIRKQMEI